MAEDVSNSGHWGNGDYRIIIQDPTDLEYLVSLIKQSFDQNLRNASPNEKIIRRSIVTYSEDQHVEKCDTMIKQTYNQLKNSILSISPNITVKANKYYTAFVNRRNFVSVRTRRSKLVLKSEFEKR
jgi:predicted transport protein